MTIEEAIEILDLDTSQEALDKYAYYGGFGGRRAVLEAVNEACQVACAALRAQLEAEKNEPLTLAELREMDGEPVWIRCINSAEGEYHIVRSFGPNFIIFEEYDSQFGPYKTLFLGNLGKTWLAYRRRPEGLAAGAIRDRAIAASRRRCNVANIGFYHSAFADSYEKQANEQGYTLGEKAEEFDKIAFSYNMLRIHGYFTEKQEESICQKIQQRLVASLKPLSRKSVEGGDPNA